MVSLGRFIFKENLYLYIKRPRLAMVWFLDGPEHSKTEQNGRHFVFFTIRKPNFETFGFRMDLVFECSEFQPPL